MPRTEFTPPPALEGWIVTLVVKSDPDAPYAAGDPAMLVDAAGAAIGRATVIGRTDGQTPGVQALTLFRRGEIGRPSAIRPLEAVDLPM